jgi:hypothetical protein
VTPTLEDADVEVGAENDNGAALHDNPSKCVYDVNKDTQTLPKNVT